MPIPPTGGRVEFCKNPARPCFGRESWAFHATDPSGAWVLVLLLFKKKYFYNLDRNKQEPENPAQKRGNGPWLLQKYGPARVLVTWKLQEPGDQNVETA